MVEGPGVTKNGRRLLSLVGEMVAGTRDGTAVVAAILEMSHTQVLTEVVVLGKELWLVFVGDNKMEIGVRLHFGMTGSIQLETQPSNNQSNMGRQDHRKKQTLQLEFEGGAFLRIYDGTASIASPQVARMKYQSARSRDVCSAHFDAAEAANAIRAKAPSAIISDALLDQDLLPGCGNIIKNEALARARIDPRTKVSLLTPPQLSLLVAEVRSFSLDWLSKGYKPPKLVYDRTTCGRPDCGAPVKFMKLGESARPTFWCSQCQGAGVQTTEGKAASVIPISTKRSPSTNPGCLPSDDSGLSDTAKKQCTLLNSVKPLKPCATHGVSNLKVFRVRKEGDNFMRLFCSCRAKNCKFFEWADASFPRCRCGPGARVSRLRVSKQAHSGGRWFFSCAGGQKGPIKCDFFAWASPEQLQPLGSHLTPLL